MKLRNLAIITGALALATWLAGCATPVELVVKPTDLLMAPRPDNPYNHAIGLGEMGDTTSTSAFNDAFVGKGTVSLALTDSLKSVGYLAPDGRTPPYVVDAVITENVMDIPVLSTKATSTVTVRYTLKESSSGAEMYNKAVRKEYTAGWDDTWSGPNRPIKAKHNAVRLTVQQFLDDITSAIYGK